MAPEAGHALGMVRVRAVVSGRVQGVFYRQSTLEVARRAGLAGWVHNRGDGKVEAELEGERAAVDRVLAWMAEGPPAAVVMEVDVTDLEPTGETGFGVR